MWRSGRSGPVRRRSRPVVWRFGLIMRLKRNAHFLTKSSFSVGRPLSENPHIQTKFVFSVRSFSTNDSSFLKGDLDRLCGDLDDLDLLDGDLDLLSGDLTNYEAYVTSSLSDEILVFRRPPPKNKSSHSDETRIFRKILLKK